MTDLSKQADTRREEPLDPATAALEEAIGLAFRILKGVMVLLMVAFLGSGFFTVEANEVGFVRHLGVLDSEALEPGLHWCWPVVDEVVRVNQRTQTYESDSLDLFRTPRELLSGEAPARAGGVDPRRDGYLLTGDANLVHVSLTMRLVAQDPYHRANAKIFRRPADELDDREKNEQAKAPYRDLVHVLLERSALRTAAHQTVDSMLGGGKTSFLEHTRRDMQLALDQIEAGLQVEGLDLARDVRPPPQVNAAFEAVSKAHQVVDKLRSEAQGEAAGIKSAGGSEATRIQSVARGRAKRFEADSRADAEVFEALMEERRRDPRALEERLLSRTLAKALDQVGEIFLLGDDEGELRIRLERNARAVRRKVEGKARKETRGE